MAWNVTYSLGEVGRAAAEKGLKGSAWQAALSLFNIGMATSKSSLQNVATEAAKSLAELAVVKKELVHKAFHEIKSKLEDEGDRKAVQRINGLYEQELQRLRAEQQQ